MDKLYDPKEDILTQLNTVTVEGVDEIYVSYLRPMVLEQFPAITFYVAKNVPVMQLDEEIWYQGIEVVIDLYADDGVTNVALLKAVAIAMQGIDYLPIFINDVADPDQKSHITTTFKLL